MSASSPVGLGRHGRPVRLPTGDEADDRPLIPILRAMAREDFSSRLGEIRLPVVVICGTEDRTTPKWHSELLGTAIPGARGVWVEGKGHLLNWEAPQALVDVVGSLSLPDGRLCR